MLRAAAFGVKAERKVKMYGIQIKHNLCIEGLRHDAAS